MKALLDYNLTLDTHKRVSTQGQVPDTSTISVILSTRNDGPPTYHHAQHIESIISKDISKEIIIVHYNQREIIDNNTDLESNPVNTATANLLHLFGKDKKDTPKMSSMRRLGKIYLLNSKRN